MRIAAWQVEDQRVRLVEAPPTLLHLGCRRAHGGRGLIERRRAAQVDEESVRRVSEVDVRLVHG